MRILTLALEKNQLGAIEETIYLDGYKLAPKIPSEQKDCLIWRYMLDPKVRQILLQLLGSGKPSAIRISVEDGDFTTQDVEVEPFVNHG